MALAAGAAHADLTYVTRISSSADGKGGESTTYIKGNRVRSDVGGRDAKRITITDGTRTWLINNENKTYSVVANQKLQSATNPMMEQFNQMIDVSMSASVKPGGKTRTILGKSARNYLFSVEVKMKFKPGSGPKNARGDAAMRLPAMQAKGEIWTTDTLPTPPRGGQDPAAMFRNFEMLGPSGRAASAAFAKVKGFPLETILSQITSKSSLPGEEKGGKTSVKMSVVSLKTDPIADSVFAPPKGFKQVPYEPPTLPDMSGGGGM